jgi:hypothetical protein
LAAYLVEIKRNKTEIKGKSFNNIIEIGSIWKGWVNYLKRLDFLVKKKYNQYKDIYAL